MCVCVCVFALLQYERTINNYTIYLQTGAGAANWHVAHTHTHTHTQTVASVSKHTGEDFQMQSRFHTVTPPLVILMIQRFVGCSADL